MEAATREIKLETIRRSVEECSNLGLPAIKEVLISECSKWWGTRRQSSQELLKDLMNRESIFIEGNDVWSYDRWEKIKECSNEDLKEAREQVKNIFG